MNIFKFSFVLIVFFFCRIFFVQAAENNFDQNRIVKAINQNNTQEAISLIEELKASRHDLYLLNNYDYLHGRLVERINDYSRAISIYSDVLKRNTILVPFALDRLAKIEHKQKHFQQEQNYLKQFLENYPSFAAVKSAKVRLARSYEKSEKFSLAISLYKTFPKTDRENQGRLGFALYKIGQVQAARVIFNYLLKTGKDDQSLFAAEYLDKMDFEFLSEAEHLKRGKLYLDNRNSDGALKHFLYIVDKAPKSSSTPELFYSIGRAYYIAERWDNAVTWYNRVHREFPISAQGELGFYQAGHALQNAGKYKEAVARYEEFLKKYPNSKYASGAYLNGIDSLRLDGNIDEALIWCERCEKRFNGLSAATTALFNRAKILLTKGEIQPALSLFTLLQSRDLNYQAPGSTNRDEVVFMKAYCLEQLHLYSNAVDLYLTIPNERNHYYGQRASSRLLKLRQVAAALPVIQSRLTKLIDEAKFSLNNKNYWVAKQAAQQAIRLTDQVDLHAKLLEILVDCYKNLPEYSRAWNYKCIPMGREFIETAEGVAHRSVIDELCFLDLYDDAVPFLSINKKINLRDWNYSFAVYASRGNLAWHSLTYGENVFGNLPNDFLLELMPREVAELLFPAPYRDELTTLSKRYRLDPRLLLSIARQESRFNPNVKSQAAARGLFQFIDSTADKIAEKISLKNYFRTDLYEPDTSILFATEHVSSLSRLFPKRLQPVIAAYNAGESSAKRWLKRTNGLDLDLFTAEVGYVETKDYVYKVMSNYYAYKKLYTRNLITR